MSAKKVALVIAHNGYQSTEYGETKKVLEDADISVITVSDKPGTAHAADGSTASVDMIIPDLSVNDIDGLFFIGGPDALVHLDTAWSHTIAQKAQDAGIPLGAICLSVRILAHADILATRKATGWDGDNKLDLIFQQHNVTHVDKPVVVDGKIITAHGPDAAHEFGKKIVELVKKS